MRIIIFLHFYIFFIFIGLFVLILFRGASGFNIHDAWFSLAYLDYAKILQEQQAKYSAICANVCELSIVLYCFRLEWAFKNIYYTTR